MEGQFWGDDCTFIAASTANMEDEQAVSRV